MNNYNLGDKFVVTINEILQIKNGCEEHIAPLYQFKGLDGHLFDDNDIDQLELYNSDEKANDDYNKGYADGLSDAWECLKKIHTNTSIKENLYGKKNMTEIYKSSNIFEAIGLMKEFENRQGEIKVGDEVVVKTETFRRYIAIRVLQDIIKQFEQGRFEADD